MTKVKAARKRFARWVVIMLSISLILGIAISCFGPSHLAVAYAAPLYVGFVGLLSMIQFLLPVSRSDFKEIGPIEDDLIYYVLACIVCILVGAILAVAYWAVAA
jgi:hypothetical protein